MGRDQLLSPCAFSDEGARYDRPDDGCDGRTWRAKNVHVVFSHGSVPVCRVAPFCLFPVSSSQLFIEAWAALRSVLMESKCISCVMKPLSSALCYAGFLFWSTCAYMPLSGLTFAL